MQVEIGRFCARFYPQKAEHSPDGSGGNRARALGREGICGQAKGEKPPCSALQTRRRGAHISGYPIFSIEFLAHRAESSFWAWHETCCKIKALPALAHFFLVFCTSL